MMLERLTDLMDQGGLREMENGGGVSGRVLCYREFAFAGWTEICSTTSLLVLFQERNVLSNSGWWPLMAKITDKIDLQLILRSMSKYHHPIMLFETSEMARLLSLRLKKCWNAQ